MREICGNVSGMPNPVTYLLSNLAAGEYLDLEVAAGQDVLVAAQAQLRESGLPTEVQQGFFVSVYPHRLGRDVVGGLPADLVSAAQESPEDHEESVALIRD